MTSLYENIEDWQLERLSEEFEDHYDGFRDEIDPKRHSFELPNENGEGFGNRNNCNGTNGIQEEANDRAINQKTNDSNDEHEAKEGGSEGEEGNMSTPYYGRTLVAPEYMSFKIQDPPSSSKEDNGVEAIGEKDCTVAGCTDDFGKGHGEEEETSHSIDQLSLEEGEGDSCEGGDGECETGEEVNLRDEDHVEDSPRPARREEEDGTGSKDDFNEIADLEGQNEQERDENELASKEGTLSENDEVDNVYDDEGDEQNGDEDDEQGGDEKENDEDYKGSTNLAGEKEPETDENEAHREEPPSKDGSLVEELSEDNGEDGEHEKDDAKTEETVETEEKSEDDAIKRNIEDNEVDEKHDTDEKKDHREEETNNEDEESSQEEDESDDDSEDDEFHHDYKITEDKDVEGDNEDKSVSAKDMAAINRLTRLEHCDSLRVNVASPTRDITNVSSTESLNETDAGHVEGDDPDKQAEKLREEPEKEPEATINEPLEVNDEQQNDDDGEEIASEDDSCNSGDFVENVNKPGQDVRKEDDHGDDNEEDLKPDLEGEVAKYEGKDEEAFPVHRKPQGHEDEADLTGKVKELGRMFEGGGPVYHKGGVKKDLNAADGSPVSVRKFKAIFETHQYSAAERNQEPGRKEESSSPPRGIVKNLRGLFENPQSFETRNG